MDVFLDPSQPWCWPSSTWSTIYKNKLQQNSTSRDNTVAENRLSAILDDMAKKPIHRRAHSYIRFSSAEQEKGDSLRRQAQLRDKILGQHPEWTLDETPLQDFGISVWEGANINTFTSSWRYSIIHCCFRLTQPARHARKNWNRFTWSSCEVGCRATSV